MSSHMQMKMTDSNQAANTAYHDQSLDWYVFDAVWHKRQVMAYNLLWLLTKIFFSLYNLTGNTREEQNELQRTPGFRHL